MKLPRQPRSPGGYRSARILLGVAAFAVLAACGSSPSTPAPSSSGPAVSASTTASRAVSAGPASAGPASTGPASAGTVSAGTVSSPRASARPSSSTPVPASAPAATGSAQSASGAATTLTGTLSAGVESGCIVLVDDKGAVLANLIGLDAASAPIGSTVEVKGRFARDLITTCQQGEPFTVASVEVR